MTLPARKPRARIKEPARELSVYDGGRLLGVIRPKGAAFVAHSAGGLAIGGAFATSRDAMRFICAHDRAARLEAEDPAASPAPSPSPASPGRNPAPAGDLARQPSDAAHANPPDTVA